MITVVGVFRSTESARRAARDLSVAGFNENINLLLPGAPQDQHHVIPASDTEQPGMGRALGGVVGAAVGIAGGFEVGSVAASAVIPGVGPVLALGFAAAALAGIGGGITGAKLGSVSEQTFTQGLPADEIFFYEDALRQGRSLVIIFANGGGEAARARELMSNEGAETLDAAREDWWIGLRDAEKEHYTAHGGVFERDQEGYREGFEAALRRETRGKSLEQLADYLKWEFPDFWDSGPFRMGFERGQLYRQRAESTPGLESLHPTGSAR
jgi:hypothetical protein